MLNKTNRFHVLVSEIGMFALVSCAAGTPSPALPRLKPRRRPLPDSVVMIAANGLFFQIPRAADVREILKDGGHPILCF